MNSSHVENTENEITKTHYFVISLIFFALFVIIMNNFNDRAKQGAFMQASYANPTVETFVMTGNMLTGFTATHASFAEGVVAPKK